ncbi:MAG TPA: hypothetical protein VFI65_25750 [Streptosporangiaceae bacterium]|nr:hypothetical protein [Streptosporangiaceae bacterium]
MTEQGYPPRHPDQSGRGRPRVPREARNSGWQQLDAFAPSAQEESDLPPWAIPGGVEPIRPVRRATRTVEVAPEVERRPADYGRTDRSDQPGRPEHRAGRSRVADRPGPPGHSVFADDPAFSELPDVPGEPELPGPGPRRPRRSRAAETRRRRGRRRLVTWGSAAVVIVVLVGVGIWLAQPKPAPKPFITTLQKGEFKAVPNTCKVISASTLGQVLSGKPSKAVPTGSGAGNSECTFTVDAKPVFRVLDVKVQAFGPNLIAPGNGSATSYAVYLFSQGRQSLAKPAKGTAQPSATIRSVPGLGSKAFSAAQVYHQGKTVTDRDTVMLQYRNVLITISLWANDSNGFGPVSPSQLQFQALSVARSLLTTVKAEPTES